MPSKEGKNCLDVEFSISMYEIDQNLLGNGLERTKWYIF